MSDGILVTTAWKDPENAGERESMPGLTHADRFEIERLAVTSVLRTASGSRAGAEDGSEAERVLELRGHLPVLRSEPKVVLFVDPALVEGEEEVVPGLHRPA